MSTCSVMAEQVPPHTIISRRTIREPDLLPREEAVADYKFHLPVSDFEFAN